MDSTGKRIAWVRKQAKMTGHDLARAVGVRNIYISQVENDHRVPSRQLLQKIAAATSTTVGFLLMETDDPAPSGGESELTPIYFSPEADEAAQIIDAIPDQNERLRVLLVVRALASTFTPDGERSVSERVIYLPNFTQRLILRNRSPQARQNVR